MFLQCKVTCTCICTCSCWAGQNFYPVNIFGYMLCLLYMYTVLAWLARPFSPSFFTREKRQGYCLPDQLQCTCVHVHVHVRDMARTLPCPCYACTVHVHVIFLVYLFGKYWNSPLLTMAIAQSVKCCVVSLHFI